MSLSRLQYQACIMMIEDRTVRRQLLDDLEKQADNGLGNFTQHVKKRIDALSWRLTLKCVLLSLVTLGMYFLYLRYQFGEARFLHTRSYSEFNRGVFQFHEHQSEIRLCQASQAERAATKAYLDRLHERGDKLADRETLRETNAKVRANSEGIKLVRAKAEKVDAMTVKVNAKAEKVDAMTEKVNAKTEKTIGDLAGLNAKLDEMDDRLSEMEKRLGYDRAGDASSPARNASRFSGVFRQSPRRRKAKKADEKSRVAARVPLMEYSSE